ncbi:OmpA family protein [Sulfurimonas sp.]|jgi:peptidoglycan-associated lipoprotein|uniref:OmpA family protein n=1 Tax=Sulfurimonas sp. TaxID=2022749 RepID=UPI0025F2628C|nr:OmpA family protein [Sulfurimonas sp.]MCK9473890.1 OmpA family protein [Sulfurimonas sp.]
MKSIVISSAIAALLVLSGCGDKDPKIDDSASGMKQEVLQDPSAQEVAPIQTETVSSSEAAIMNDGSANETGTQAMMRIEKELLSIYFDFDKFNIRSDMQGNLSTDSNIANTKAKDFSIKLEGNCDEWGSDEYNFALGLKRANTVKKALVAEGVNTNRISMVSFGESNPVCNDKTKDCWAKNRRVDFKLLP